MHFPEAVRREAEINWEMPGLAAGVLPDRRRIDRAFVIKVTDNRSQTV